MGFFGHPDRSQRYPANSKAPAAVSPAAPRNIAV
jgi:hypothetical protein